jgi:hypothetical protein
MTCSFGQPRGPPEARSITETLKLERRLSRGKQEAACRERSNMNPTASGPPSTMGGILLQLSVVSRALTGGSQ